MFSNLKRDAIILRCFIAAWLWGLLTNIFEMLQKLFKMPNKFCMFTNDELLKMQQLHLSESHDDLRFVDTWCELYDEIEKRDKKGMTNNA